VRSKNVLVDELRWYTCHLNQYSNELISALVLLERTRFFSKTGKNFDEYVARNFEHIYAEFMKPPGYSCNEYSCIHYNNQLWPYVLGFLRQYLIKGSKVVLRLAHGHLAKHCKKKYWTPRSTQCKIKPNPMVVYSGIPTIYFTAYTFNFIGRTQNINLLMPTKIQWRAADVQGQHCYTTGFSLTLFTSGEWNVKTNKFWALANWIRSFIWAAQIRVFELLHGFKKTVIYSGVKKSLFRSAIHSNRRTANYSNAILE